MFPSDKRLTLEMSAFEILMVVNLPHQLINNTKLFQNSLRNIMECRPHWKFFPLKLHVVTFTATSEFCVVLP